eukprot:CAMPEP_0183787580 /NCGR_PEP_ID=MMETSP0739-20130205/67618_1 /TAXON_ID=385413 /ORGANISM="Thalassiosira miniscula, Strain CCMP1093" /LENGTH=222 /DNA_ID=CAMNT_0026031669 /DNA_START=320 /DNA_END=985 /DNA_ORIENTATION=+
MVFVKVRKWRLVHVAVYVPGCRSSEYYPISVPRESLNALDDPLQNILELLRRENVRSGVQYQKSWRRTRFVPFQPWMANIAAGGRPAPVIPQLIVPGKGHIVCERLFGTVERVGVDPPFPFQPGRIVVSKQVVHRLNHLIPEGIPHEVHPLELEVLHDLAKALGGQSSNLAVFVSVRIPRLPFGRTAPPTLAVLQGAQPGIALARTDPCDVGVARRVQTLVV